jgi:ISXO2-like transposase domain
VSALGLQRALRLGSYRTAWTLTHKLRRAMIAPERAALEQLVGVDETYLGGPTRRGQRGRGAIKTPVMIGVELTDSYKPRRVRLERLERVDGAAALAFAGRNIVPGATVGTDAASIYPILAAHGYQHWAVTAAHSDDDAHVAMPAVHRVASLHKRWLLGTHQGAGQAHQLDAYLDEFAFRCNRRRAGHVGLLFHRLLEHAITHQPEPYPTIRGRPGPQSNPRDAKCITHFQNASTESNAERQRENVAQHESWTPGPTTMFFLFTANDIGSCTDSSSLVCAFSYYCAYHSNVGSGPSEVLYANMPYADFDFGLFCDAGPGPTGDDADATINVTSNEHNEAITDPLGSAWYDSSGNENGDYQSVATRSQ